MRKLLLVVGALLFAGGAQAQQASCSAQASERHLAGAARQGFMTRCERDAKSACEAAAKEKKLAGAARTSFTTKCLNDAVGS